MLVRSKRWYTEF